ncbi:MAG: TolC family protein [Nitrospiraceae bacterium]|nr:TolC family protein [Nitrospiraceae bacterium]
MGNRIGQIVLSCIAILLSLQVRTASGELLTLSEGLRLATENSRLVKISRGDERISETDTRIERARLFPTVNASASGTMLAHQPAAIFGTQTIPMSQKDFYAYNLTIQQTLYDFRENASLYESSKARLEAARLDTARVKNLAAIDFALIYFDLLQSEKMVTVGEKEVERLESHLRDAKNLYEEGVITRNDLLQAEVRLSDSRQRLLTAKTNRQINASRLNSALVRPLMEKAEVVDVKEAPPESEVTISDIAKAWEEAEKERPEIRIVDATLKSLDLDEEAKKAEFYPKIVAVGSYDYTKNQYQTPQGNWEMTLGLGINLFSGWKTTAEVAKIRYQREKLLEQRKKLVDDVRLEVEKYLLDARTARDRVAVTKDAVRQAEENLRINRVRYTEGVGTATEVLDAVTLLSVAETNHYQSVYDLAKSEIAVLYAVGKDLSEVYR